MTHTSTEQPEALRLADEFDNAMAALHQISIGHSMTIELRRLHARVQELEAERDEADRRAGRAERHMAGLNDDVRRFEAARRRMKAQWGVHDNVSFDVVWQQALDAKASQAQRVPLNAFQRRAIFDDLYPHGATSQMWQTFSALVTAVERFDITQEKQG